MMTNINHNKRRRGTSMLAVLCTLALLWVVGLPERSLAAPAGAPATFSDLAKKASPSVVNISTVKVVKGGARQMPLPFGPNDPFKDFFDRFFRDMVPKDFKQQALGSGFIIDKDGYIVTNNHVVEKSDEIKVKFSDGKEFTAKIVGKDPKTDLALIKIDADRALVPLAMGDSDKLDVGDWVVAIGNPFGLGNTVTAGIVSAKYRHIGAGAYDNYIQTDASINPGNSGGPLLNTSGEVVGVNTAIYSQSGGSIGIGFAIPINMAKDLIPQLKQGKVVRGWLGVMIQKVTPELRGKLGLKEEKGALVADVTPGGPADKSGIKRGDVIVTFDGREIKEMNDLPMIVASTAVGKTVLVEVWRKNKKETLQVKIGELKDEEKVMAAKTEGGGLGMSLEEITPERAKAFGLADKSGLVVVQVEDGSPAADGGVRPGDVILEMDQTPVRTLEEFNRKVEGYKKGDTILLLIKRQKATLFLTLKVAE
ncbi:MAG: DegQ family serine endoprotease [Thermodesulfobacteriota bacterium]